MLKKSVILCGFMSSGKTTVGKALAEKLEVSYADTDELLIKTYKMSISEIFENGGESHFRDLEHEIAKSVKDLNFGVISTGGGMLTFDRNGKVLRESGTIICLTRKFDSIYEKLAADTTRPLVKNKTKEEIRQLYDARVEKYQKYADYTISNDGSVEDCVQKIIAIVDDKSI